MIARAPEHLMLHQILDYEKRPVWLHFPQEPEKSGWYIFHGIHKNGIFLEFSDNLALMNFAYQTTWFAYDHAPEHLQITQTHPAKSGLTVELPCPLGSDVFTVECIREHRVYSDYYDTPLWAEIKQAIRRRRKKNIRLYVKKHTVDAFLINHAYGVPGTPQPYRFLDHPVPICGYDGEWYFSENDAEEALSKLERENNA